MNSDPEGNQIPEVPTTTEVERKRDIDQTLRKILTDSESIPGTWLAHTPGPGMERDSWFYGLALFQGPILKAGSYSPVFGWLSESTDSREFVLGNVNEIRHRIIEERQQFWQRVKDDLWFKPRVKQYLSLSTDELIATQLPPLDDTFVDKNGLGIIDPKTGQLLLTWEKLDKIMGNNTVEEIEAASKKLSPTEA